jgi:hypothetical protein
MRVLTGNQMEAIFGGGSSSGAPASGSSSGAPASGSSSGGSGNVIVCPIGSYPAQLPDGSVVCVKPPSN